MPYRRTGRPPGRPRHPGPFTPAEERVVDGVREGLSNAEIAARLGVSSETVKTHVTNMLVRLDLPDRHALAEWQPGRHRAWWQRVLLLGVPGGGTRTWPWALLLGGGVLALAMAVFAVARRGNETGDAPGAATATHVAVLESPTPKPRKCGDAWAVDSRIQGTQAALVDGLRRIPWQEYLPDPSTDKYTLEFVSISGAYCSPKSAAINLNYRHVDGRQLLVYQVKRPLHVNLQHSDREISGYIVTGNRYSWHYVVYRRGLGGTGRYITISDTSADGITTQMTLEIGASEDATIEELRGVARAMPRYEPVIEPTHPPYEEPVQADSYTPSPGDWCPHSTPPRGWESMVREHAIEVAPGVVLQRMPFEIGWYPGRGMLVDIESHDAVFYDERGRRIAASLCTDDGTTRLHAVIESQGFRERVREFLARPNP